MSSSLSPVPSNAAVDGDDGPFVIMPQQHLPRAESSTSQRKRRELRRSTSAETDTRPFKRVREATPISNETETADVPDASTAEAVAPVATTSGEFLPDEGDERRHRERPDVVETSEKEEPSVLFSEQEGARTEPTEAIEDGQLLPDEDEGEGDATSDQVGVDEYPEEGEPDELDAIDVAEEEGHQPGNAQTTREMYDRYATAGLELTEYHSGDSDDFELDHRPILDRAGIKRDIRAFMESMDVMADEKQRLYQVVDRLGEGTFSSVYLAYDRRHGKYYNDWWTGVPDQSSRESFDSKQHTAKVALKRVLATSSPQRIENELDILESLRGCRNVSQIITAFRQEDQVIIVLPYHHSDDFRLTDQHFYRHMDAQHIRWYMGALLRSLADTHARGIVHRDVKPANFLFDYETGEGVLCDFGLAERYAPPKKISCQHLPGTLSYLGGARTKTADTPAVEQAVYDARKRSRLGEGRIGFPQEDKRPAIKTNRAGTRGFRAPEVLLKCPDQTVAIDVWSAGVMLLSILTHKFPLFNSSDDIEALMEIAAIFGRPAMEKCALLHNRTIMTNCPTVDQAPPDLTNLILTLNPHLYTPPMTSPSPEDAAEHIQGMDEAIELCTKLLRLDATKRVSAKRALSHPFFANAPGEEADRFAEPDEPILLGTDGKCGHLHQVADGKHRAWFYKDCQEMHFGQGIPTATDKLCPEHEHWQQRTLLNPVSTSRHFTEPDIDSHVVVVRPEDHSDGQEDELIVDRPVFTTKDLNTNDKAPLARQHGLSKTIKA